MQSSEWLHSQLLQVPPIRARSKCRRSKAAKDGYVGITMVTGQQWLDFAAMVDCPELTEIRSCVSRSADGSTATHPRTIGRGWPNAPSPRSSSWASCSGCRSRRWATVPPSAMDGLRDRTRRVRRNPAGFHQPRTPWLMSDARPRRSPAPALGEATTRVPWPAKRIEPPSVTAGCRSPASASST
jgi:hypothetical protein